MDHFVNLFLPLYLWLSVAHEGFLVDMYHRWDSDRWDRHRLWEEGVPHLWVEVNRYQEHHWVDLEVDDVFQDQDQVPVVVEEVVAGSC